jgi:MYXO-CTERM domain-containing protein
VIRQSLSAALVVAALAGAANATLFSFASDNANHTAFTFIGKGSSIAAAPQDNPTILYVDDNNGPLAPIFGPTRFVADLRISFLASVPLGGGNFIHNYALSGGGGAFDFGWVDFATGAPILTAKIRGTGHAETAVGPAFGWGSTATLQGADSQDADVVYTWWGDDLPAYGLYKGDSVGHDDFSFTLTWLQHDGILGVPLDSDDASPDFKLPATTWISEGSFSGSANFVPTPGAIALLGLGGLVAGRRKR